MKTTRRTTIVAASIAGLAVGGGGAALAATQLTPKQEGQAVLSDAAAQLGVSPERLTNALEQALKNRVDAAVADGRLTQQQADELKSRIDAGELPLFGVPEGHVFRHHGLDEAANFLGLSEDALREQLESGKTLAEVARSQGKSVDGLIDALVAEEQHELDEAVADGRLTRTQADEMLAGLRAHVTDRVNGVRSEFHGGFRFGGPRL
jgi:hypothetical protein